MSRANPRYHRTNASLPAVGTTNGVVMVRIQGSIENQMTLNTFYYSAAVPAPTQAQLTTLLNNIMSGATGLWSTYPQCLSADWVGLQSQIIVAHRNDIATVTSGSIVSLTGLRPAGHAPTEVAAIIARYCAVKGQHGRGRIGLPGISTTDVAGSFVAGAHLAGPIATLALKMLTTFSDGTNTWTPCIAQRSAAAPKLVIGFSPLVTTVGRQLLGTVRRRKIGRGK